MNVMQKTLRTCLCLLLLFSGFVTADTLISGVDRTAIAKDETLTLTVTYDGDDNDAELDTSQLEQQFSILGRNRSSRVSITNGSMNNSSAWIFELQPKKSGQLLIPSFQVNGEISEAISIAVSNKPATNLPDRRLYTEVEVDKSQPLVQEQIVVSWRLVTADRNVSRPSIDAPQLENVLVYDLGTRQYQRSAADSSLETVLEQRMAFFPQHSGALHIPSLRFNFLLSTPRRFATGLLHNAFEKRFLNTEPKTINVAPAPVDTQGRAWVPAQAVGLSQQLAGVTAGNQATVGQVLTRTIVSRSVGLMSEQLSAPNMSADGFKTYAEKPTLQNESRSEGVIGTRLDHVTVIPTHPGTLTLPAISIPWFNTASRQWENATLPAQQIQVNAAAGAPAATSATNNGAVSSASVPVTDHHRNAENNGATTTTSSSTLMNTALPRWWWLVAMVAVTVVLALLARLWVLQRRLDALLKNVSHHTVTPVSRTTTTEAQKTLDATASSGDAKQFANALLTWAQHRWPHQPPRSLQALAETIPDHELQQQLLALDASLYGSGAIPSLMAIATAIKTMPSITDQKTKTNEKAALQPLYR